ncbi:MAG TPA: GAF domain-containing protein [Vicinamibacteria bacterium]|nr:GAF domain-containing protein [Vicinamibacteria bacterium]
MSHETAEHARADEILRIISEGTASAKGEEFFRSLARHLASALRVKYAFVAECTTSTKTHVRTLAVWNGRDFMENVTYAVAGTPCERVIDGEVCFYPTGVRARFPEDRGLVSWNTDSYLGVPLHGSTGEVLGHLAVLDENPIRTEGRDLSILRIFAARTGVELERQRAEEAVDRYTKRLETLREIDRGILAARSPAEIAEAAMRHIRQLIPCRRASVTVFDLEAGHAVWQAVHAEDPGKMRIGAKISLEPFGSLDALREGQVNVVKDARILPSTPVFDLLRGESLRSWINVPLVARGELIGTLNVGSERVDAFGSEEIDAVREVADSLAIATQQARLNDQVQRHTAELEKRIAERTAELEAFSYSVAHDLRAPLRTIVGFSRVLLDEHGGELDPEGMRVLHIISDSARNMGHLIDDLLALSRLGRQEMSLMEIDMGELARSVFDEVTSPHPDRNVEWRLDALPSARGDRGMIRQVFANLLSNALKFTAPREMARIEVGHKSEGGENAYYVKDNGVGFDMRFAERMFGVFQRLHRAEEFEGTGVGLAIVQSIIRRHGGRVWVEGKPNEGATIGFTLLPARRNPDGRHGDSP